MKKLIDFVKNSVRLFNILFSLRTNTSPIQLSWIGLLQESRTSNAGKLEEYEETIQALQKEKEEQAREMEEMRKRHAEEMEKLKQEREEWENKYRKVVHTMSAKHGVGTWNSNSLTISLLLI